MATKYERGRQLEWRVRDDLKDKGYHVLRSAGSKTKVDLVASGMGSVLLIQCKIDRAAKDERLELHGIAADCGALPVLATKTKEGNRVTIAYELIDRLGGLTAWTPPSRPSKEPSKTQSTSLTEQSDKR